MQGNPTLEELMEIIRRLDKKGHEMFVEAQTHEQFDQAICAGYRMAVMQFEIEFRKQYKLPMNDIPMKEREILATKVWGLE